MKLLHLGIWNNIRLSILIVHKIIIKIHPLQFFFSFLWAYNEITHLWICHSFLDSARRAPWEHPPQIKNKSSLYDCSKESRKYLRKLHPFAILFFISLNIHQKLVYFYCVHRGKRIIYSHLYYSTVYLSYMFVRAPEGRLLLI